MRRRWEVRATDARGDLGVLVARYWWRWRADRRRARADHVRAVTALARGWTTGWHYYVRDTRADVGRRRR